MSRGYFILCQDGSRVGPCAEEEILDLLSEGSISPEDRCEDAASGRVRRAGEMFHVISTDEPPPAVTPPPAAAPAVAWKPAPFPDTDKPVTAPDPAPASRRARLLYRGNRATASYWRYVVAAAGVFAAGWLAGREVPEFRAVGLIGGSMLLLAAVLLRLRSHYLVFSSRVELIEGWFIRSSRELPLTGILAISVRRTGIPGLLGIGDVHFAAAAGPPGDIVFRCVPRAAAVRKLVRDLQEGNAPRKNPLA